MSLFSFLHLHPNLLLLTTLTFSSFLFTIKSSSSSSMCSGNMDAYHKLNIVLNPNGTLTRLNPSPVSPAAPDPSLPIPVLSKDLTFNKSNHTWVRIFLPRNDIVANKNGKLPLVVFFHGGGFIFLSAGSTMFHDFCLRMADHLRAVVVSVEYRLAPEHRLPAAYDDAMDALHWIKTHPDQWLTKHADFSNCYLMGSSAGGNIAYHAGLRASSEMNGHDDLKPLKIKGLILVQPFFGGIHRSESEMRLMNDSRLPLCVTDLLWELSLPVGANRDHEYCNPTVGDWAGRYKKIERLRWRVLVTGCDGDPLVDRQMEVVKMMKEKDVEVVSHFTEGDYHGIQDRDQKKADELYEIISKFISEFREY